jgi:mercuric ion transport protein|tara:strand:- start:127 stop:372 length:246 start_codon:yes stop_codon:yes gene_type:complete
MNHRTVLGTGVVGSIIAAVCCFTPALVLLLGAVGLSAWVGWLDHILLPALAIFLGLIGYGVYLKSRSRESESGKPVSERSP